MPYIVAKRSFIQSGAVQVKDLWPNISQRNSVIDPQGTGPIYAHAWYLGDKPHVGGSVASGVTTFSLDAVGLIPYLIANVEVGADDGGGGYIPRSDNAGTQAILNYTEAKQFAQGIFDLVARGLNISDNRLNSILDNIIGTDNIQDVTGNNASNSSVSISDVVRIVAGEKFVVPAGLAIQDINAGPTYSKIVPIPSGSFAPKTCLSLITGDTSWEESLDHGDLAVFTTMTSYAGKDLTVYTDVFGDNYDGLAGLVAIYDTDGTLVS